MVLNLDHRTLDRTPGHPSFAQQLADHIHQAISTGELLPGDELPSEHEIMDNLDVSRNVVRPALALLVADGLIIKRSGMPTRVATRPPVRTLDPRRYLETLTPLRAGQSLPDASAFTLDHGAAWTDFTVDPLEYSQEQPSPLDAELLQVPRSSTILRRRLVKNLKGVPLEIVRLAVAWDKAKGTLLADRDAQPVPGGFAAEMFLAGYDVEWITHSVQGRPPNTVERRALDMQTVDWVWDILRIYRIGSRPVAADRTIAPMSRNVLKFDVDVRPQLTAG